MITKPFEKWMEIEQLYSHVYITEKIDGTNAQVDIEDDSLLTGSRERWITPEDDNYGFSRHCHERQDELIKALGPGRHFGEWWGSGIARGYGLIKGEKRFSLFNAHRWTKPKQEGLLPAWVDVVPILYSGSYRDGLVPEIMAKLKETGSIAAPGFMRPEGIVVYFSRQDICFKYVFEAETTPSVPKTPRVETPEELEANQFLQPIRLEKLFAREEFLLAGYPITLPKIAGMYCDDLVKEYDPAELTPIRLKNVRKKVFVWIKDEMKQKGYK